MPLGRVHHVLCVACRTSVTTLYAYEPQPGSPAYCGYTTTVRRPEDDKLLHVSCTEGTGNERCETGVHFDKYVQVKFEGRGKLGASRHGHTGRALCVKSPNSGA